MVGLAPRAREKIVRPRRPAGVGARPLNFTVRVRNKSSAWRSIQVRRVKAKTLRLTTYLARAGTVWGGQCLVQLPLRLPQLWQCLTLRFR